jgi:hypothetical protein
MSGGTPARPRQVEIAFWLTLLAALIGVGGILISLASYPINRAATLKALETSNPNNLTPADVDEFLRTLLTVSVIVGVALIAAAVVCGLFVRRGVPWARIALTILAGLSFFGVFSPWGTGFLQFLCLGIAALLTWQGDTGEWFRRTIKARPV